MKRLDRRTFMLLASVGTTGAVLTACGNDPDDENLTPTMIPDVSGAPPTLAPNATPGGGASAPEEEPAAEEGGGGGDAGVVEIEAQDPFAWSTNELQAAPGQVIRATNVGFLEHNFTVDELGIAEDLPPGEPVDITVPDDAAVGDTYDYYCSVPGHREGGMEGVLTIVEAGAAAPASEATEASPEATPEEGAEAEAAPAEGGAAAGGPIEIEAQDPFAWSTNELEVAPGQVIQATNVGFLEHNFTVDDLGIAADLPPGEPVEITVPEDAAVGDTYDFYCSVPGHREGGMEGTLTIVEAGAAAPAGEAADAPPAAAEGEAEAAPAGGGDAGGDPIEIEGQDPFAWSVNELEAAPGQVIRATNVGFLEHNFTVDELEIAADLPPGEPVEITVPDSASAGDSFEYYCSVPGHREGGMVGTLTII